MSNNVTCPYCDAFVEINHDDGYGLSEDEPHQQECERCEKTFVFYTWVQLHYRTTAANCLNGGEHAYQMTHTYPHTARRMRCKDCGADKFHIGAYTNDGP